MDPTFEAFKPEADMLDKVLKVYGKSRESFDCDVKRLTRWMENQPHFPEVLETKVLQNFLLLNKCNVEDAKQKIDMYYTVRLRLSDIYSEINPKLPHMKRLSNIYYLTGHPKLTDQMYRVCFFKIHNKDLAESWQIYDLVRNLINIQEIRIREDITFGDVFVIDFSGITFYQQMKITPTILYNSINLIYKNVYNLRVKGVYLLNFPSYGGRLLAIVRKFLSPKIMKRVHICSDKSVLKEYFPVEMIPKDFGGEGPTLAELQDILNQKFIDSEELYDRLDKMKIDDDLRPEKLNDDVLGFYGSFKKLEID